MQQYQKLRQDPDYEPEENVQNELILGLINEFENYISGHLLYLKTERPKQSLSEEDISLCQRLEIMLKEECSTWRLVKALLLDQAFADVHMSVAHNGLSESRIIDNILQTDSTIRRMQMVCDWLEKNAYDDLGEEVDFFTTAWENTLHAIKAKYSIDIPDLDITANPQSLTPAGVELVESLDPDAPIRTDKALDNRDKEVELSLFKHIFMFLRAGEFEKGQNLARKAEYHWLASMLDGWFPYLDERLDREIMGPSTEEEENCITGNKKRDIWKQTCFKAAKMHGLHTYEKAIVGSLSGNLKSVLPVCKSWSDQLWARLKCSIDVKIEKSLRESHQGEFITDYQKEFYENDQDIEEIFKSIQDLNIASPFKEATIYQVLQKHLILDDVEGLLEQLDRWCETLDYDENILLNSHAISPHFLRCFAHIILLLREVKLVTNNDERSTKIIKTFIGYLTQRRAVESVAYYTTFLPFEHQVNSFARLLATIDGVKDRQQCLQIAKSNRLDVDEITQTVVELIFSNPSASDKQKIDALDYLLLLERRNHIAILHHANILMRRFGLEKKMEAIKDTFAKLPTNLGSNVETQWREHTNSDPTESVMNNIRELNCFGLLLEAQEELVLWSEQHRNKPEEPRKPAHITRFCDTVKYDQDLEQYKHSLEIWRETREQRTDRLMDKIKRMFYFPGGWMKDIRQQQDQERELTPDQEERQMQLNELRKYFIPHMTTIYFNVLQLINSTKRLEDCLKVSHLLVDETTNLHEEFSKDQMRDFLSKISEVAKKLIRREVIGQSVQQQQQQQ